MPIHLQRLMACHWAGATAAEAAALRAGTLRTSLAGRFFGATFWSLVTAAVSQASGLLVSVAVARLLGKEEFGAYGMVQATLTLFGALAGLGLGVTAAKFVAEWRDSDPVRAGRIIGLSSWLAWSSGLAAAAILIAAAPSLSAGAFGSVRYTPALQLGAILLFLSAWNGAQTGVLAGLEAFRDTAVANAARLALLPAIVWMLLRAPQIETAIAGLSAAAGIGCVINCLSIRRRCAQAGIRVAHAPDLREWKLLFTFSLPVLLSSIMVGPVHWMCNAFLLRQPNGYAQLGIFAAAGQWHAVVTFIPAVLAQSSLPMLSNLQPTSASRYRQVLRWNLWLTVIAAASIAVPLCVFSRWIMGIYGNDFSSGSIVLVVCAGVGALTAVNAVLGALLTSAGEVWPALGFNSLWALTVLVLTRSLVPVHGALGLAMAFLLAYCGQTIWQGLYGWHVARRAAEDPRD